MLNVSRKFESMDLVLRPIDIISMVALLSSNIAFFFLSGLAMRRSVFSQVINSLKSWLSSKLNFVEKEWY